MEVLLKTQSLVVEHAFTIGIVLFLVVLLAGLAWFSMTRTSKSPELVNMARVNEATTVPQEVPPTQEQLEEMAQYRAQMESQQQAQVDNASPE